VRGLIVDLRKNGGGDAALGEDLLRYLTDKPFRLSSRKEWKSSAEYRRRLKQHLLPWIRWLPLQYCSSFGREFWGVPEGSLVVDEFQSRTRTPSEPRFRGPVCFLIGRGTFSSAMMLADGVGTFHLATLIGEETGGEPNSFGEIYPFAVPHTHLGVWVSSARHVRANGDATDPRGVLPDIEVRASPADIAAGRDVVLEAARSWIGSSPHAAEPR
jgi:C-terminal processing protease CtpA/Prc